MMYSDVRLIVDVDGTLCKIKNQDEDYSELVPIHDMVEKLRFYKENGAVITLFTSRNMKTYGGNLGLINVNTAPVLIEWLKKWNIPYDEILFGKPWPGKHGFYVDDRSIRPDEFLKGDLSDYETICDNSRIGD